jgi:hypothetical protein
MRSKKFLLQVCGLALLGAAQAALAASPAPQDPDEKLARQYETFATRTLARYYEENTFLVKAMIESAPPRVEAVPAPEPEPGEPAEAPPQLPGLPFLPEAAQPEPSAPAKAEQPAEPAPRAVTLDVLVDTSYSEKDVEFVRSLLAMAAHMDEARGDNVKVHEGVFPRDNRSLADYRKPSEAPLAARSDSAAKAAARPEAPQNPAKDKEKEKEKADNPFKAYLDHLPSLIPMLIICLLILACVWMVSRAIASSKKEKPAMVASVLPMVPEAGHASAQRPQEPSAQASADWAPKPAAGGKGQPPEFAALRPFMLNCFVGSPKYCGQIIKSWIQRESEKGLRDAAAVVNSLDPRLMGVLGPELGKDYLQKLEGHLHMGEAPPAEDLLAVYKEFKREFENLSGNKQDDQYKDLFGFLHQINEQQVMHILRDESAGIAGLVLAQLPPEVASGVLQKVDPENRAKLLISMGNIDNIPLNVYKEIANRLSLKALDVSNMRYVAADGVDSILELIDNLPLNLQYNYIRSISEMDLGLAEKIRNRYVTMPEVAGLPDKFLSGIVQNVDSETLVLALLHSEEAIRNKIYALLPERMQMMVASGVENARDATPKESEAAQRRILHRIRDEIRFTGRPA